MSEERNLFDFAEDIMLSAEDAIHFIKGMTFDEFSVDRKTINAVIRSLEVIGEATKHIPEDFRILHPQIPWRQMAGMRDRLTHGYFGVDLKIVWETVNQMLPQLSEETGKIINSLEQGE